MIRVLHVDDNKDDHELIEYKLRSQIKKIQIDWAKSGQMALEVLADNEYDCILSDYQMPGMDGLQFLSTLREIGVDIPFIFLTGQGNEAIAAEALRAGADDYYTKVEGFAHYQRMLNSIQKIIVAHDQHLEHSRAVKALEQSELQYRTTLNSMGDAIHVIDRDFRILLFSKMLVQLAEKSSFETDVIGRNLFDAFPMLDDRVREEYKEVFESGRIIETEEADVFSAQEVTTITRKIPVFQEGEVVRVVTVLKDITEQKRAEEALRKSEMEYRLLADNVSDNIWIFDLKTLKITYSSPSTVKITGFSPEEVLSQPIEEMFTPHSLKVVRKIIKEELAKDGDPEADPNRSRMLELEEYHKDGSTVWVEIKAVFLRDNEGKPTAILGVTRDISERKRAEGALRKSEGRHRTLIEASNDAIFLETMEGHVLDCNSRACEIYGYTKDELMSMSASDLVDEETAATFPAVMAEHMRTGRIFVEAIGKRKDGSIFPTEVSTRVTVLGEDQLVVVFARDITERKRAEEALRESEELYRTLVDLLPDAVYVHIGGKIVFGNKALFKLVGVDSLEQVIGKSPLDFAHPDYKEKLKERSLMLKTRDEALLPFEGKVVRIDGTIADVEATSIPITYKNKRAIQTVVIDITDRKNAEAALLESEKRFRNIFENSTIGIYRTTPEGEIILANAALIQMLGFSSFDELVSRNLEKEGFEPSYPRSQFRELIEKEGEIRGLEAAWKKRDGTSVFVRESARALRSEDGKVRYYEGTVEDITDRKMAEEALREKEEHYRNLYESALVGLWRTRISDGKFFKANIVTANLLGYSSVDDLLEDCIASELYPITSRADFLKKLHEHGEVSNFEAHFTLKDGTERDISISARIYPDRGYIEGVTIDISERKRAEGDLKKSLEQLERRTSELEALNKELETFSYTVSHDLCAPLRHVEGFCQLLSEEYGDKLDERGIEYLQRIIASGKRMGQLIADLLRLSHVTRGELAIKSVNLSELACETASKLQRTEPNRKVRFEIADGLSAEADARLMQVVFENLLGNAWKFTKKRKRPRIKLGVREHDARQAFFVEDNGVGFDPAEAENLFTAFMRLHPEEEFAGSGIGLATVQRIVHRHGGLVWAEGKKGKGATFYFTLG